MDTPTDPHVKHQNGPLSLRRRWAVLAICASALFLVGLDTTIVTVALPHISDGLGVGNARMAWVVDAYTVPFASLLITAGALADRFGRRRVFRTGLVVFGLASLACAAAPSAELLITARIMQGTGASMLTPVALAIVVNAMPDPRERARAIGVWAAMFGVSMAAGPVTGGLLVTAFDWRAVFWINGPLVLTALLLVSLVVPESRSTRPRHLDIPGQVLLILILATTVMILIEGPGATGTWWTSPTTLTGCVILLLTTAGFHHVEKRRREPLVDPGLFRIPAFTGAVISAVVVFAGFSLTLLSTTLLLQSTLGWSAVATGAATLPMAAGVIVCAPLSGRFVGDSGPRVPLLSAGACLVLGGVLLLVFTVATQGTGVPVLLIAYLLIGSGVGLSSAPVTTTAVNSLPPERAGVAGGFTSTARQVGTALGVAVAGSITAGGVTGWVIVTVCGAAVLVLSAAAFPRVPFRQRVLPPRRRDRMIGSMRAHDIIIIGGGAAGLSAAELLGRARRDVLVIDSAAPRNRFAPHMHGVLGHDGLPPLELLEKGRAELDAYGVTVTTNSIESVTEVVRGLKVTCTDDTVEYARAVLVASGIDDVLPDVPGLADHWGDAVFQCPYCHGWEHRDQRIGVLASSPMLFQYAQLVRNWTEDLTVFVTDAGVAAQVDDATQLRFDARGITLVTSPVAEIVSTDGTLTGVRTDDGTVHPVDALGIHPEARPRDGFLAPLDLKRTETPGIGSFLTVDAFGQTSHPRVWAAGNVIDPRANVPSSMGQASMTAGMLNTTLVTEDTDNAVHALTAPTSHDAWPDVADDEFWEATYSQAPPRWSGRPNPALVRVLTEELGTSRGRAVDIGSGEGADTIWLATQGWDALGVEVSATAARRSRDAATAAGVDGVSFTDTGLVGLLESEGDHAFDLVTASYLHAPSQGRRSSLLLSAGELVAPGGHLFILSHVMPDAAPEESGAVDALGFDETAWELVRDETVERAIIGYDRELGGHPDRIVLLRRR